MSLLLPYRLTALCLAVLTAALISGYFYAYHCSVMIGLDALPPETAIAAMQAINSSEQNLSFAIGFYGTLAFGLLACLLSSPLAHRRSSRAIWFGTALYGTGCILVTALVNQPLNETLASIAAVPVTAATYWRSFAGPWRLWNAVRMLAGLAALSNYVWALRQSLREDAAALRHPPGRQAA